MSREVQIKFMVKDVDEFMQSLSEQGCVFVGATFEKTIWYDYQDNSLQNKGVFVRTKEGFSNTVTIKHKVETDSKYFDREKQTFEVQDCKQINFLLTQIGLTRTLSMEKYRMVWKTPSLMIHIDELPFGVFCDLVASEKKIDKFLKKNDITQVFNCTYWDIAKQIHKKEEYADVLFDKNHIFKIASII